MTPDNSITLFSAAKASISMFVPPPHSIHNLESYVSGDVTIHPTAAIALGVILQATPNGKIIIGAGVCIGMGCILQVSEDTLEIEVGANLGAGVLVVGSGKIGASAMIGAATTILNPAIPPGQLVPPGSILGDTSRQIVEVSTVTSTPEPASDNTAQEMNAELELDTDIWEDTSANGSKPQVSTQIEEVKDIASTSDEQLPTPESKNTAPDNLITFGTQIYGQVSVKRLMSTLFPHSQKLREPLDDESK